MSVLSLSVAALASLCLIVDTVAAEQLSVKQQNRAQRTPTFGKKSLRRTTTSGFQPLAPHHILNTERAQQHLAEHKFAVRDVIKSPLSDYTAAALKDEIVSLPGLVDEITFRQFSGFLPADTKGEKFLHYWFVESQVAPKTDPFLWWTNGGPGCSGLIGFFEEHGPFRVQADGETVLMNPYSWNKIANVMYIEAPVGIGYSYSTNPTDYTDQNDATTSLQNYIALGHFFERFPQFQQHPLYLSGESFGGHYVPQLTGHFIDNNNLATFAGVFIGNPIIDTFANEMYGCDQALFANGLVDWPTWQAVIDTCITPFEANPHTFVWHDDNNCIVNDILMNAVPFPNRYNIEESTDDTYLTTLDPYGLNFPYCSAVEAQRESLYFARHKQQWLVDDDQDTRDRKGVEQIQGVDPSSEKWGACLTNFLVEYLNRTDVLSAINIDRKNTLGGDWNYCSDTVRAGKGYDIASYYSNVEKDWEKMFDAKINVVLFSGDDDIVCGNLGTQYVFNNFKLLGGSRDLIKMDKNFIPWIDDLPGGAADQIAGFVQHYDPVTVVTVHAAGHEVSYYQPERGYSVFQKFIVGQWDVASANKVAPLLPLPVIAPSVLPVVQPTGSGSNTSNAGATTTTAPTSGTPVGSVNPAGNGTVVTKSAATTVSSVAVSSAVAVIVAAVALAL